MLSRIALFAVSLAVLSSNGVARAANPTPTPIATATPPSEATLARSYPAPPVRATAAVVMDATNGKVMMAVNPHRRLPMASTTKVMTALLAIELGHLSDRITVPRAAFNYESDATIMGLRPGQVVTLRDLLYGLLLPSGADAANTIAIHYAGSETKFVAMMNQEAQTLGMQDTHYVDATGLSSQDHYTSAYDLADLGQYVSYLPQLIAIASTRSYTWDGHALTNINRVLYWYPGVDGIKPGYTGAAGLCQLIDVRRDGRHITVAILNTPDLVIDARNLLNYGLRDYTWIQSALAGDGPGLTQTGTDAQGRYLYYPASGHYVRGAFLQAFQRAGGPAALGFPRTEPLAESVARVQYFQNGALSVDHATGKVSRIALGRVPLPGVSAPKSSGEPRSAGVSSSASPTPTPHPHPAPTPSPIPATVPTDKLFQAFQRSHAALLGGAVSPLQHAGGYALQIFTYGALVANTQKHTMYFLPIGDRLLAARGYLPRGAGNAYPTGFAPPAILGAVGWLAGPPTGRAKNTIPARGEATG